MTVLLDQPIDVWHVVKGEPANGGSESYSRDGFNGPHRGDY
jgi:hypothetical protein